MQATKRIVAPWSKDEVQRLRGTCLKAVPCGQKTAGGYNEANKKRGSRLCDGLPGLEAVSIVAISPARGEGSNDSSPNIALPQMRGFDADFCSDG